MLAFFAGTGLVFWLGIRYNALVATTAFLALAIGIDDSFLIVTAWQRHANLAAKPGLRLEKVMEVGVGGKGRRSEGRRLKVLEEAASSMTLTSLTDVVAFGIGASNVIPALRSYAIFTALTLAADFLFQVPHLVGVDLRVDASLTLR